MKQLTFNVEIEILEIFGYDTNDDKYVSNEKQIAAILFEHIGNC